MSGMQGVSVSQNPVAAQKSSKILTATKVAGKKMVVINAITFINRVSSAACRVSCLTKQFSTKPCFVRSRIASLIRELLSAARKSRTLRICSCLDEMK